MQQKSAKIPGLIVLWIFCQAGLHLLPGLVESPFLFKPYSQNNAGIHRVRIHRDGARKAASSVLQLPQALILLADHGNQIGVVGREVERASVSVVGLGKIKFAGGGVAQFKPKFRNRRQASDQRAISAQGETIPAGEQLLLCLLPARSVFRRN
jgi:hypothetical protein